MECCIEGSGVHMVVGTGGAPEGVLAAAALKCVGGDTVSYTHLDVYKRQGY